LNGDCGPSVGSTAHCQSAARWRDDKDWNDCALLPQPPFPGGS
jgi:hypothetical protein